jgi:hypothetical protein
MDTLSFRGRTFFFAVAALIAGSTCGCGNYNQPLKAASSAYQLKDNYSDPFANGGFPNDVGYTCPTSESVNTAGTLDKYTVCPSSTSVTDISVHGKPSDGSNQIYVYPVEVYDSSHWAAKLDQYFLPLKSKALDASSGTVHTGFAATTYNAVFIISSSASPDQMTNCLHVGDLRQCPAYTYVRFRDYIPLPTGNTQ